MFCVGMYEGGHHRFLSNQLLPPSKGSISQWPLIIIVSIRLPILRSCADCDDSVPVFRGAGA